jgi:hypothetical protein
VLSGCLFLKKDSAPFSYFMAVKWKRITQLSMTICRVQTLHTKLRGFIGQ